MANKKPVHRLRYAGPQHSGRLLRQGRPQEGLHNGHLSQVRPPDHRLAFYIEECGGDSKKRDADPGNEILLEFAL